MDRRKKGKLGFPGGGHIRGLRAITLFRPRAAPSFEEVIRQEKKRNFLVSTPICINVRIFRGVVHIKVNRTKAPGGVTLTKTKT
jgi:hypothetical protein